MINEKNKIVKQVLIITATYALFMAILAVIFEALYPAVKDYRLIVALCMFVGYLIAVLPPVFRHVKNVRRWKKIQKAMREIEEKE